MSGIIGLSTNMRSGVVGQKVNNRPAFSAYLPDQVTTADGSTYLVGSNETWTEIYDSNNKFDAGAGVFTPSFAGYYFLYFGFRMQTGNTANRLAAQIYKNTVQAASQEMEVAKDVSASYAGVNISSVIYLDSGDTCEAHVYQSSGGSKVSYDFNFHGFRVA